MTESQKFYTPVWEYQGFQLVSRPDSPNYHIAWTERGHRRFKRKSTRTSDLEEAQQVLVRHARRHGRSTLKEPDEVLVLDLIDDYVNRDPGRKPCCDAVVRHLETFCRTFGTRTVADLSLSKQEDYIRWRRDALLKGGYTGSNGTIARELVVLRAALRYGWQRGLLANPPYVKSLPAPPPRQRYLSVDEVHRLLDACDADHTRMFIRLGVHTLQRPGAILGLRVEQVDLDAGRIDFLPPGALQTKKRKPVVPITGTLYPHLETAVQNSLSGHVIEFRGKPIKSIRRTFNKARDLAGLGSDVCPYTLRHTGATLMSAAGVPLREISGMLAHTDARTTELYAKHSPDFMSHATRALDSLFGPEEGECAPKDMGFVTGGG